MHFLNEKQSIKQRGGYKQISSKGKDKSQHTQLGHSVPHK